MERMKQLTVKISTEKEKSLKKYANQYHNGNVAKSVREFIDKGLAINSYKDDIDFIRQMINEEIENSIEPYMKRIISICVKGGVMSASSHFALAEVLQKLVDPKYRRILEEVLTENKKRGYAYITSKELGS